nr:Uncharacterised protein [Raoultella sp. NCTC 9187]
MVRNVSVGVSVQRSTSLYDNHKDNIVAMSLSVPFGNPQQATRARFYHHPCGLNGRHRQRGRQRLRPRTGEPVL